MKVITTTFIRWEPTGQTQAVVTGHDSCGFGGWSKCTVYGIQHVYVLPSDRILIDLSRLTKGLRPISITATS